MAKFWAYFIDTMQHIRERRDIEAQDSGQVVSTALQWLNGEIIEVWQGDRLIADLEPQPKQKPGLIARITR
jgi:hypothetical protein